jgi:hypothetical protein
MSLTSFDAALLMQDSTAHLSNCLVVGGSVAPLVYAIQAGIGIRYYNGAVWLVDCDVRGGDSNNGFSPGGHAVRAGGVPLRHHRCTLTAGTGPGGAVAVIDGPAQAGPLLGVTTTPEVLQLGSTFTIHFAAEPADPVFTLATTHVVYTGPSALLEQHALGFFGSGGVTLGFGLADASGHLQVQVAVPTTASLLHLGVWFRGIATASLPLQASPVVGGVIR